MSKIEKLAVPAKVTILQSTNIWVGDLGVSVHCTNDRTGGINIHEGSSIGTMGGHGDATTAISIVDIAMFGKEQSIATLNDVQYNPKSNFNLFSIEKVIKEGWKLSGDKKGLVHMKDSAKLVCNIKITTQNDVIICGYLWRDQEISAILTHT